MIDTGRGVRFCLPFLVLAAAGCAGGGIKATTNVDQWTPSRPAAPLREGVWLGQLSADDELDEGGRSMDVYAASLQRGTWVRLWVVAPTVDTQLMVRGPDHLELQSDDFVPGSRDPLIEFEVRQEGTYLVRVASWYRGGRGPYRLGLTRIRPGEGPTLSAAGELSGRLVAAGTGTGPAYGAQAWLSLSAGARIRLRATSSDSDLTASLVSPTGEVWTNDDAGDTGPEGSERVVDSTVTAMAPTTGWYHVIVAPYGGTGSGTFRLRASVRAPVVLGPGETVPSTGFAGRQAEGRILGLFAGISDYPDGRSPLYGCADDATLLAEAFRARGLQSPAEQTVLVNMQANAAAFIAGLQQLAARARQQDVVVIFFSGHGASQPASPGEVADIDGTDETILLYDRAMTDNEVVALIDSIAADVVILALDTCHSGGFARDFLVRPGRIGLFSSDEDVLSDTAQPLAAGGYLAHALRRAVLGEADLMPHDGMLVAGELTDFIHLGFVRAHHLINPPQSRAPMQWFVASRGSVGWREILWLYPRNADGSLRPVPQLALQSPPMSEPSRPTATNVPRR